ncbi:MAG: HAMP domain-containing histidine kinase [Clostridia bacterium]|nr:HAMP domain-containing histidine kinase [Clostridia bacterium]
MKKTRKKLNNAVFRRYFGITSLIVVVALIVLGLMMIVFTASQWWNEKTQALSGNATMIVETVQTLYAEDEFEKEENFTDFVETLRMVSAATDSDYFLVGENGRVIACKDCGRIRKKSDCEYHAGLRIPDDFLDKAMKHGFTDYVGNDIFGIGKFVVATSVDTDPSHGVVFGVEDAITGLLPYVLSILKTFFFSLIAALVLSFIIIFFFSRGITTPLNEMEEVTKHFAKGEFQHRANENYKKGYLSEFAKGLNQMADELAIEEEAQRSFIANVSHELKTPMTTISGFIDGILDGTIPPEREREYLTIVSREVKRLSRIVVSMLNLSKIEAGEVNLSPIRYDISAQIFETLLPFEQVIEQKHIHVVGFESMGTVTVNADRDLLQQVIYNLLDNAVKFTPDGGTISIRAKNTISETYVSIRNTGSVNPNELSRIFERFYKVDKSRSFDIKGVGLGLYIVKTIVNMHDGEIKATGKEGEYVQFAFRIPL